MFNANDYSAIDRTYFFVFQEAAYCIIIKSKSTSHFWKLVPSTKNNIEIYHSHQGNGNYHLQCIADGLNESYGIIMAHDRYQLSKRKKEYNDFDYIPLGKNEDYFVL